MSFIAISQSVDIDKNKNERKDCLDQRWFKFLNDCGLLPLSIPNNIESVKKLLVTVELDGIVLTGGNDLCAYGGNAPERDETETFLIKYAIDKDLPLLGVCRGMQMIQHYFGVKLSRVDGHIVQNHQIEMNGSFRTVNSYHNFGAKESVADLEILAKATDGVIEAVYHKQYPIQGILWHPERSDSISEEDKRLLQNFFRLRQASQ